jgi:hypothetical protein
MKITPKKLLFVCLMLTGSLVASAQNNCSGLNSSQCDIVNALTTAVPFLRIAPDARAGGMGDVGIATSPDPNSTFHNPAKLAFIKTYDTKTDKEYDGKTFGVSMSYTPWLRSLVNDIYLAHLTGYYKINKMQAVAMSIRYFSLGQIQFTDQQGNNLQQFRPNEFAIDGTYSRILAKGFSTGISLRFIYSNLASGQSVGGTSINPGIAASADIGFYYNTDIKIKDRKSNLAVGLVFSNLGSKISYTNSARKDFIPMNMGFGLSYSIDIDKHNSFTLSTDINKLLVPTPDPSDSTQAWRDKSVPAAIFGSFSDAPGGGKEELKEFTIGVGAEYWYDKQFAVRVGYFHEAPTKGNRRYLSAGLGLRYSVFGLDFSYLIPTSAQRNPLDNTLRFTLVFNFKQIKQAEDAPVEDGAGGTSRL